MDNDERCGLWLKCPTRHTPHPHTAHIQDAQEERGEKGTQRQGDKRTGGQTEDWTANDMALKKKVQ